MRRCYITCINTCTISRWVRQYDESRCQRNFARMPIEFEYNVPGHIILSGASYSPTSKATRLVRGWSLGWVGGGGGVGVNTVFVSDLKLLYWMYKYATQRVYVLYIFRYTLWQTVYSCTSQRVSLSAGLARIIIMYIIIIRECCVRR